MKTRSYYFLVGFVVWSVVSAIWYLFGIKGVVNSSQMDWLARLLGVLEVLLMLLGACLLGFGVAWWLKEERIQFVRTKIQELQKERYNLYEKTNELRLGLQSLRTKLVSDTSALKLKLAEASHEKETVQRKLAETETFVQKLKIEKGEQSRLMEGENLERTRLTTKINELESIRLKLEQTNLALLSEIKLLQTIYKENKQSASPIPIRPSALLHKDDLTKIKGIGPFIEKRLNMLGIYNFKQLSELDSDMLERIGAAIEFFPDRILRENWIGQARNFASK